MPLHRDTMLIMKLFRKTRFAHIPATLAGYVVWLLAAVFLATVFIAVDKDSHSVSDTFYGVFPYFASTFLLVEWFASKTAQ